MFLIGIFIHFAFLFSIFDIYFKSPILKNIVPHQPQHDGVADRLVLFVVDGLRADSFVNYTTMKYLRSVANSHGRWGISNTQVPTESRPGHVALIAGFYEDPSAVFKGWKENPVDFDSVFNQTTYTWCWGTYDIVNIFTRGLTDDHIMVNVFDPYEQNFSADKNTTLLDAWVFNKVKIFFEEAKNDEVLKDKLQKQKIVFFLHLLGTDTAGHTHKPSTLKFFDTLAHVDKGIKDVEKIIRDYYGDDKKTTFLMTSDHGMTDWGSHGAGDNHETETPYVIWGAGVKQVLQNKSDSETTGLSLAHRLDINQVDVTPLMSTILSIPVPVNSIGQPINGLLDMTQANRAKAIYSISRQLASQYDRKRIDVESNALPIVYQPYKPFTKRKYDEIIALTERLMQDEEYEELIIFSEEIIHLSLSGLRYYHNYYQRPLLIAVTLSFLGWVVCLLKVLSQQKLNTQVDVCSISSNVRDLRFGRWILKTLFLALFVTASYLVYVQSLPLQYYLYFEMPIILWCYAMSPLHVWMKTLSQLKNNGNLCTICFEVISYALGCFAIGMSFTYRWTLSIPLVGMGAWPFFSSTRQYLSNIILIAWTVGCLLLSMFSFIPVVGKDTFIELVITAGCIWFLVNVIFIWKFIIHLYNEKKEKISEVVLCGTQMMLLAISLQNIYVQSKRFEMGTQVSYIYQFVAWSIAGTSCVLPTWSSKRMLCRLMAINTSIITFYLLVSVAHEGLFIVALTFHLMCWLFIEFRLLHLGNLKFTDFIFDGDKLKHEYMRSIAVERSISNQDFRRSFFFVMYIILAFFGTGNIASLNSFEIRWVTCFVTSFKPTLITTLILLKTFMPFLIVGCTFRAVQTLTKAPVGCLNIMVLIYSNLMGVQLLYNVRNTGSWLEIGTSISQFVIVQVITVFLVIIGQISNFLTNVSLNNVAGRGFWSGKKNV